MLTEKRVRSPDGPSKSCRALGPDGGHRSVRALDRCLGVADRNRSGRERSGSDRARPPNLQRRGAQSSKGKGLVCVRRAGQTVDGKRGRWCGGAAPVVRSCARHDAQRPSRRGAEGPFVLCLRCELCVSGVTLPICLCFFLKKTQNDSYKNNNWQYNRRTT